MNIERYTASWCGPCQLLAPVMDELQAELDVIVDVIDVDANKEKAEENEVRSVPTIIFKDSEGEELERVVGLLPKNELAKKIEQYK